MYRRGEAEEGPLSLIARTAKANMFNVILVELFIQLLDVNN